MKRNPFIRLIVVLALALLGLWLLQTVLFGAGMGVSYGFRGNFGGGHMYMYPGVGYGFSLVSLLLLLTKVLFAVFVIALVAAIVIWIKNNMFTAADFETMKNSFKGNGVFVEKGKCSICGKALNADWKVCPHCGKEVEANA
ncbi:MAG TPA: hypothetical protein VEG39_20160 [Clostridia bacterium]|nr:hypothetical protein [Clostridia bacterium]